MTNRLFYVLAMIVLVASFGAPAQAGLDLGDATSFAALANQSITNTGNTTLEGDIGVSPGTSITGFFGTTANEGPGTFTGTAYQGPASLANQARLDAENAYNILAATPFDQILAAELGGTTLTPGVYRFTTEAQLTGLLTLQGLGDYIFQIGSTLNTAAASSIFLTDGARSGDIFWQVGSSATLGTTTDFYGTIIADQSVSLGNGATLEGRVMAINASITFDNNTIVNPIPEPTSLALLGLGALGLIARHRRPA